MSHCTVEHPFQRDDWQHQLIRWGKYLIPKGAMLPIEKRVSAPVGFVRLEQVAVPELECKSEWESGEDAEESGLESDGYRCSPAGITYRVAFQNAGEAIGSVPFFSNGLRTLMPLPSIGSESVRLYRIPGGHCVGRNGCLMDAQGNAIRETAFLYKPGMKAGKRYLPFDPRHWKHLRHGNLTARSRLPRPYQLSGVAMSLNNCSCHNFYHWMTEIAPRIMSAKRLGWAVDHYIVDHQSPYQKQVLELLGTRPDQWLQPHCNLNLKCSSLLWSSEPNAESLRAYADAIKGAVWKGTEPNRVPVAADRKIYITRRAASHRKLRNEQAIVALLVARGFEVHDFDAMSFREQASLMGQVSHVVSIHGAALANMLFAPSGAKIVEIVPAKRANYYLYPNQSRIFGHRHVVVEAASSRYRQWLECNPDDLLEALKELDQA